MEIYKGSKLTQTALIVYPATGNYQHKYVMDQVKFLIDEVGMDGIYFDSFGFGLDYSKWDGVSVDIDPLTGEIKSKYTDTALAAAKVRAEACKYILSRGKMVVCNGAARLMQTQALPVFRFMETEVPSFKPGEKPPPSFRISTGQLGSPIALMGAWGGAEKIYRAVIMYLRHGLVCYFYNSNFPETGEGSGDYGPFRHMFPLTPVGLHEGWIEGKERIITCVSGRYLWKGAEKPNVYLFDDVGREKRQQFAIEPDPDGWFVEVKLKDWREIAVIETNDSTRAGGKGAE